MKACFCEAGRQGLLSTNSRAPLATCVANGRPSTLALSIKKIVQERLLYVERMCAMCWPPLDICHGHDQIFMFRDFHHFQQVTSLQSTSIIVFVPHRRSNRALQAKYRDARSTFWALACHFTSQNANNSHCHTHDIYIYIYIYKNMATCKNAVSQGLNYQVPRTSARSFD